MAKIKKENKFSLKEICEAWKYVYGENFRTQYSGIYKYLKNKNKKFPRIADDTGNGIRAGYYIERGIKFKYCETYDGLIEELRRLLPEFNRISDNELMEFAYSEGIYYYTEWDENDIDD